jgi:hypothetical protein
MERLMMYIDVCNGDADGLCSVVQWRLHEPRAAQLITGLKRDIQLLDRVQAGQGDELLVCDLSMRRNRRPLMRLLEAGVSVRYFDHHKVDEIPVHPLLEAHIDVASNTCTSLLVDRYLGGQFRAWAVVGAFGDNLTGVAEGLAVDLGLSFEDRRHLQSLGESINYNAYGDSEQDVHMAPAHLYELLVRYPDPLLFLERERIGQELDARRQSDLRRAQAIQPHFQNAHVSVYLLPDAPWSRRVSGSFINVLAAAHPQHAHALLTATALGDFVVSVRAPLCAPVGAAEFCRGFGGDGRAGAAGIDHLPAHQLARFIEAFSATPWGNLPGVPGHS